MFYIKSTLYVIIIHAILVIKLVIKLILKYITYKYHLKSIKA